MDKKSIGSLRRRAKKIVALLDEHYPTDVTCFLHYYEEKPWQLLIATILSAQCTDARVNMVTEVLFAKYETLEALAGAEPGELERDIHSTGFYRHKAKNILLTARMLLDEHGGALPSDMEPLLKLPGVGRKTANLIRSHIFQIPCIVVDTHVKRVSTRLGLSRHSDPDKIEFELAEVLPKDHWIAYNTQVIEHGRAVCVARGPRCGHCFLREHCGWFLNEKEKVL